MTGLPGLHAADDPDKACVEAKTIRERLGYPVGPRGGVSTKGSASAEVRERLQKIFKELREYVPHAQIKPMRGDVKMRRVVYALNSVLQLMYCCSFVRCGKSSLYVLKKSELFVEHPQDQSEERAAVPLKPTLPAWGWGRSFPSLDDDDAQERWNAEALERELHNQLARKRLDRDHEEEMEQRRNVRARV